MPTGVTAPGVPGGTGAKPRSRRPAPPNALPISEEAVSAAAAASVPAKAQAKTPLHGAGERAAKSAKTAGGPPFANTERAPLAPARGSAMPRACFRANPTRVAPDPTTKNASRSR